MIRRDYRHLRVGDVVWVHCDGDRRPYRARIDMVGRVYVSAVNIRFGRSTGSEHRTSRSRGWPAHILTDEQHTDSQTRSALFLELDDLGLEIKPHRRDGISTETLRVVAAALRTGESSL